MFKTDQNSPISTKLIALDKIFNEMIQLYKTDTFPHVFLLNGKKGIGKFTLVFHFLNYIYSKKEKTNYNLEDKLININSKFYNSILNGTCPDVIFLQAEERKSIKVDDIRQLKSVLSRSSLSNNPRFVIIDEVEFLNDNSANALLKTLEEPSNNNYFILVNNQQANLIETISSRCLKNNIFLNSVQRKKIIDYFINDQKVNLLIEDSPNLSPGLLLKYNEIFDKYKINTSDSMFLKINKLLSGYKKDKNKALINMSFFLIDHFFYNLVVRNENKIDFLLKLKSNINNKIYDLTIYNLNMSSVLNFIELKLRNAR
tara:strand:+ start:2878 stop:3819 length:942 start_codon:yes stop_codon:yes gene_type:complete